MERDLGQGVLGPGTHISTKKMAQQVNQEVKCRVGVEPLEPAGQSSG